MTDKEAMKLHELIDELRAKLKKSLQELLQARKDLVKAGIFMNNKNGVTAFAKLLIQLNTKYPGWRQPK